MVEAELQQVAREIIREVLKGRIGSKAALQKLKRKLCRRYHLPRFPSDVEILSFATEEEKRVVAKVLRKKPTRTLSGVAIVAVMSKPMSCPGQCIYCPSNLPTAPKAYVGEEPATLRARQNDYDAYLQVANRLKQLQSMGHSTDKVELVVMGGTFLSSPAAYQRVFMKRCFDALNGREASNLETAIQLAEVGPARPVGITIETRPDYCSSSHVDTMVSYGTTRVEIGVQTIYDDIYERIKRGHNISSVIKATQIARDAGLKICYHIMPGLNNFSEISRSPDSSLERDLEMFKSLFQRPEFKPDLLKIYPCLVLRGSELFEIWRKGEYSPYTTEQVIDLLASAMPHIPRYVRIQRMQRDIPKSLIVAGPDAGNLTQLVFRRAEEKGYPIHTIRYREAGYKRRTELPSSAFLDVEALELRVDEYSASDGTELFLAFEETELDILVGYLRLRIPSERAHRPEVHGQDAALLRELHVFGLVAELGGKPDGAWQHRGLGELLLTAAEEKALDRGCRRVVCTSGIGVRQYYRRHGYESEGPYVVKQLA
jgi:elongator complex protein 3